MGEQPNTILASLIVPIFNEEKYIEDCVRSLKLQDIPADQMEILLVDGRSTDQTGAIIKRLQEEDPARIRVLDNPRRIQASAMNIGAKHAKGEYLVRIDAHAEYPTQYVSTCIRLLKTQNAVNAGCITEATAKTKKGKLISMLMTSPFGVGGSDFRVGAESGFVDTVPFGTFRRDYFLEIGGFDERLVRSEDNEINYRIRKRGDRIYMTNEIATKYFCRETVKGLGAMAFANGKWTIIASKFCPGSMSLKYFVPFAFALSLVIMPILSMLWWGFGLLFGLELGLYCLLALLASLQKTKKISELPYLFALFPIFHVCYGVGAICGIWDLIRKKY